MLDRFLGTKGRELEEEGDDERAKRGEQAAARRRDETYYSNIPGVLKRSIKNCVPRICYLRITKLEALSALTSSTTDISLIVAMSDGRSRLRDSRRMKRAALRSAPIPVQTCESFTIPINVSFYMQYFHNLTHNNTDTFRILLQKRKKRSLVNKIIAECRVSMADLLQAPMEEGSTLILHSTGRQRRAHHTFNAPLVRIYAQLESLPLAGLDAWPDEDRDEGPNVAEVLDDKGIFSGEEEPEEAWDDEEEERDMGGAYSDDEDEWVETCETVVDMDDLHGKEAIGVIEDRERENLAKVFRSKVLEGTRKIASITLKPVRAVKKGYNRMRSNVSSRGKQPQDHEAAGGDGVESGEGDSDESDPSDEDELQDPKPSRASEEEMDGEQVPIDERELVELVEAALALPLDAREGKHTLRPAGPLVMLLYPGTRRGQQLKRLFDSLEDGTASTGAAGGMASRCISALSRKEIRVVLETILAHQRNIRGEARGATRLALLGNDLYVHNVVQEYAELRLQNHSKEWETDPPIRFLIVPVGKRGRDLSISLHLAGLDPTYSALFFQGQNWLQALDSEEQWRDADGGDVLERIERYVHGAGETLKLNIAEAFVTCTDEASPPTGVGGSGAPEQIVQQRALPFLLTVAIRAEPVGEDRREPPPTLDVHLDLWVAVGQGDYVKTSSTGVHSDILLRRYNPLPLSPSPGAGSGKGLGQSVGQHAGAAPMEVQAVLARELKISSKRLSAAMTITPSGTGSQVRADVNKLICTASPPSARAPLRAPHFSVVIDGVRVPRVRFVSVSPHLSSSLVRTFPVAAFEADPGSRRPPGVGDHPPAGELWERRDLY
ncbi:PACS-1 cytosolic sorting protein-domain-containing protein [Baffinella frigidus]|nr:PACS-1 cytosolic sorting protein-domain-containing protein [Cryptophyta sp. CCMP2293]